MDIHTGEIIAMASLPDFESHNLSASLLTGDQSGQAAVFKTAR